MSKSIKVTQAALGFGGYFLYYIMCLTSTMFAALPPHHQALCSCLRQLAAIALKEIQVINYSDEGQRMT